MWVVYAGSETSLPVKALQAFLTYSEGHEDFYGGAGLCELVLGPVDD